MIILMVLQILKICGKVKGLTKCSSSFDPFQLKMKMVTCVSINSLLCVCILNCVMPKSSQSSTSLKRIKQSSSLSMISHTPITWIKQIKKTSTAIFNDFQGIHQLEMKDDTIKLKLNINIFDYNKKCKRYDAIGNKDSNGHHSSLIYSDKTNIYIMHIQSDCLEYITSIYFYPRCHLSIQYVVITRRQSSTSKSKTVTVSITLN